MIIESLQNPRIKNIIALQQKSRTRKKEQKFVVEGIKEMELALQSDFQLVEVYYCAEIVADTSFLTKIPVEKQFQLSKDLFEKIGYRETGGVLAIFNSQSFDFEELKFSKNPLFILLEGVEKPGNLGAVLRTADAAGADAVILCDSIIDLYNPNVVRSSVGCIFTVPVVQTSSEKALEWLQNQKIQILTTYLHENTISLYDADCTQPTVIVMGTEATGVTPIWVEKATQLVKIPMQGKIDSLNMSNATAIAVFEAIRQRNLTK